MHRFADQIAQQDELVLRGDPQVEVAPHLMGEFEKAQPEAERLAVRIVTQQTFALKCRQNPVQRALRQPASPEQLGEGHRRGRLRDYI